MITETDPGVVQRCRVAKEKLIAADEKDLTAPGKAAAEIAAEKATITQLKQENYFQGVSWAPPCATLDSRHPLLMGQTLVIGIDTNNVELDRISILNLNVAFQPGNAINPAPIRASFGTTGSTPITNLAGGPYFLTWPNQVAGDTIATVTVSAVYTPVSPGGKWLNSTFYPAGAIVTPKQGNGHFYVARVGGVSAPGQEPAFASASATVVADGSTKWLDSGNTVPQTPGGAGGAVAQLWAPTVPYQRGQAVVFNPANGHYYTNFLNGSSGQPPTDPFSLPTISDNTVSWADRGSDVPTAPAPNPRVEAAVYPNGAWVNGQNGHYYQAVQVGNGTTAVGLFVFHINDRPAVVTDGQVVWRQAVPPPGTPIPPAWQAYHTYSPNQWVTSSNGDYYQYQGMANASSGGIPAMPYFAVTPTSYETSESDSAGDLQIIWEDAGTTPPTAIASGQPADQTVALLNFQFAQSHTLTYYNLASGVVYSFNKSRTFGFTGCPPPATAMCMPTQTGSSAIVDPVLLFTIYPFPWDAEAHCPHNFCLIHPRTNPPGFSFGLSLSSPSSSFYAGASFEVLRLLQLFGGYNWSKSAALAPSTTSQPSMATSSGTPVTIQKFYGAPALGLTFNVSGFIQGVVGGAAGGGSSGKGASSSSPSQ
jgi:hypothetical protein